MTTKRARRSMRKTSLTSTEPMALPCRLARLQGEAPGQLVAEVLQAAPTTIAVGVAVAADVVLAVVLAAEAAKVVSLECKAASLQL